MQTKRALRQDLSIMHRMYEDLYKAWSEMGRERDRLRWSLDELWDANHRLRIEWNAEQERRKNLEAMLTGQHVERTRDTFNGRWGISYAMVPEMLELASSDTLELFWDHPSRSFMFKASKVGTQDDLLRSLDRVIWNLENVRTKAASEAMSDVSGN